MVAPRYTASPTWADLWADPTVIAQANGIEYDEALVAVSEASWALSQLTNEVFHGPACYQDVYGGVHRGVVALRHGPVIDVAKVEWLDRDGTDPEDADDFYLIGPALLHVEPSTESGRCGSAMQLRVRYTQQSTLVPGASRAVAALAAEYVKAAAGKPCKLPERISNITRQGMSWTVLDPQDFLSKGLMGVAAVDSWLSVARHSRYQPVRPRLIDPLRGRFVSSVRVTCSGSESFSEGFQAESFS